MQPNSDFFNEKSDVKKVVYNNKKTANSQSVKTEKVSKEEKERYPEYYSLTEYQKKILVANNYWRVMHGEKAIPVPESDLHYHKYFDKRCYELASGFQKMRELNKIEVREEKVKVEEKVIVHEKTKKEELVVTSEVKNEVEIVEEKTIKKVEEVKPVTPVQNKPELKKKASAKKEIIKNQDDSQMGMFD